MAFSPDWPCSWTVTLTPAGTFKFNGYFEEPKSIISYWLNWAIVAPSAGLLPSVPYLVPTICPPEGKTILDLLSSQVTFVSKALLIFASASKALSCS